MFTISMGKESESARTFDVAIIGGGPAGLTAALYGGRAGLSTLVLEKGLPGGQVSSTDEIDNYPGLPGTTGPDLARIMHEQAAGFGAQFEQTEVQAIEAMGQPKLIHTDGASFAARSVIIASGSTPRRLGVPGEKEFSGKGVSYCATCDGAFFRGRHVAVVGGGDSAVQESLYLARIVEHVTLIHRRDSLRAQQVLQDKLLGAGNISVEWDSVVDSVNGDGLVENVALRNVRTDEKRHLVVNGVFIFIGMIPNSSFVPQEIDTDGSGYVLTDATLQTSVSGVFAAGDIRPKPTRQIVTAVGDGATAIAGVEHYLNELPTDIAPPERVAN